MSAISDRAKHSRVFAAAVALVGLALPLTAQWDPANGQWLKQAPDDLRLMTYNVQDALCSTADKTDAINDWTALARLVAGFKPDVLLLQECGDNTGNGTGTGVDGVADLLTTLELFLHGGADPFHGVTVGAFVQKYDAAYDLPHVFVSAETDGANRNAILSRYPFVDLNGDTVSTYSDMPTLLADAYAPGGDGGIRGYGVAEIDLPDGIYPGDLVVGNSHLKEGASGAAHDDRNDAAANIAYFIEYFYGGSSTGVPDPRGTILDVPPATTILDTDTLVITGGTLSEDDNTNGTKGPAACLETGDGGVFGGPDKDTTSMHFDDAKDEVSDSATHTSGDKLDYFVVQDSVGVPRVAFVYHSWIIEPNGKAHPPEVAGFGNATNITDIASDHRPVISDFVIPTHASACPHTIVDLGFPHPGAAGNPFFAVHGCFGFLDEATLIVGNIPVTSAWPVISFSSQPLPFKGGTLVPIPPIVMDPLPVNIHGKTGFLFVDHQLFGATIVMQWVILDPTASSGLSLSNALQITGG